MAKAANERKRTVVSTTRGRRIRPGSQSPHPVAQVCATFVQPQISREVSRESTMP